MYYICVENNVKIAVEDWNSKSEKVLVFVHGWPLNRKIFETQIAHFKKLGYRCISFDLRGFGDSDIVQSGFEFNQLADDLYAILKSISHDVTLIGFSTSAGFLLRYLSCYHEYKVKKLILLSPVLFTEQYINSSKANSQDLILQFAKNDTIDYELLEQFRTKLFASTPAQNLKPYFHKIDWCGSEIALKQLAKSLAAESLTHDFKRITIPVPIILGKKDAIYPYQKSLILKQELHNSTFFIMENSGHSVMFDHPVAFLCLLHHCIEEE